jgi:[ribosomal protein S5]-alanine N-acetyltransferase
MRPFSHHQKKFLGKRIHLRNLLLKDVNARYLGWLKDRDVNKYMSRNLPVTLKALREYFHGITRRENAMIFAIGLNHSQRHIGNVTLQEIDHQKGSAVFGIMIGDKAQWNKGYGKEATLLVLKYGFEKLGLKTIRLGVLPGHQGAIELYKKCGFKITAIQKDKVKMWIQF